MERKNHHGFLEINDATAARSVWRLLSVSVSYLLPLSPSWRWIMTLLLQRWPGPLYTEQHTWRWEIHLSTYNNRRFPKPTLLLLITTDETRPETSARQMRRDVAYEREPNLKILRTERRREIERQTAVNHVWTVTAAQLIRAGRSRHNPESS